MTIVSVSEPVTHLPESGAQVEGGAGGGSVSEVCSSTSSQSCQCVSHSEGVEGRDGIVGVVGRDEDTIRLDCLVLVSVASCHDQTLYMYHLLGNLLHTFSNNFWSISAILTTQYCLDYLKIFEFGFLFFFNFEFLDSYIISRFLLIDNSKWIKFSIMTAALLPVTKIKIILNEIFKNIYLQIFLLDPYQFTGVFHEVTIFWSSVVASKLQTSFVVNISLATLETML